MKWSFSYIPLIAMLLLAGSLRAQYSNQIHFRNISVQDGLSFPTINCILQDGRGFIWVGTAIGLNKYDSQKFTRYYADEQDSGSLSNDNVTCLYEDEQENLWVGTQAGLNVYNRETATFAKLADSLLGREPILALSGDERGNNWVLTREALYHFDHRQRLRTRYAVEDIAADAAVTAFSTARVGPKGELWIVTNAGLRRLDPVRQVLTNPLDDHTDYLTPNLEFFTTLFFDSRGRIWVSGRGSGARYYDPAAARWRRPAALSSRFINGVTEDANGKIWLGTGRDGLNIFDPETQNVEIIRYAEKPESNFVSNSLSCIYQDDTGGIWIGTFNNGLQYYFQHQLKFNLYYSKGQISGMNSNYITSFAPDGRDGIWIGAGEEGLLYFDRATRNFRNVRPVDSDPRNLGELRESFYIMCLLLSQDREHLFIGTLTGFYDYHIPTETWHYVHHKLADGTDLGTSITSLVQDGDRVYMATTKGLTAYRISDRSVHAIPSPIPDPRVYSIVNSDTCLYLSTRDSGLYRYSKKDGRLTKVTITGPDGNLSEHLRKLHLDRRGRLLISTAYDGLYRYDPRRDELEHLNSRYQDKKLSFMSLCDDPESGYWSATNQGLARITESLSIERIFDQNDGFEPSYFLFDALANHDDREILVGGNAGFYSFLPDNFTAFTELSTEIHLTDLLILNKSVLEPGATELDLVGDLDATEAIELPTYQNLITFEYTALDYHNPSRIEYAYRLEPYEDEWNYVSNRHFATYRDLPAGTYAFRVKYRLGDGAYSSDTASLSLTIPPVPWLSGWAFLLYATAVVLLIRQFYLYRRNRRRLRQEVAMQKFQKEKMEELYNFKLDFFTQVTHELRTPLTLIISPLEELLHRNTLLSDSKLLRVIHRNTQKLLRTVNQILDFRKIESLDMKVYAKKGNIVAFAEEILYSFSPLAEEKGIELRFTNEMEAAPFALFDQDIVEKILVNLVANAVKFTQQGTIHLRLSVGEEPGAADRYFVELTDTGQGIHPENLEKIFESFFQEKRTGGGSGKGSGLGLKMVKELVSLHHGSIEVRSQVNRGTTFLLSFPRADLELVSEEPARPNVTREIAADAAPAPPAPAAVKTTEKILIVDDEADVREFLEEIFSPAYQVYISDSARGAIDIAKAEMPDLIISDVMMPEMNGYEFCAFTKSDFLLSHIPVVLLTALNTTEHEIEGLKTGADAYVSKPFSPNLLRATVQNLLASRKKLKLAFLNSSVTDTEKLTQNDTDQQFLKKVVELIDENLDQGTLETTDISEALGMSSSTFYRKLKSLTDLSGNEFIRTIRLKRSLDYLRNTDLNISEVAYRVGFSDPKYFSTCFKKFYNLTPTEYLAQQWNEQKPA